MRIASLLLPLLTLAGPALAETPFVADRETAEELVGLFHRLDTEALDARLAEGFVYRDVGPGTTTDKAGFFDVLRETGLDSPERDLQIEWVEVVDGIADVRGTWFAAKKEGGERLELNFAIELEFDEQGRVVSWTDHFSSFGPHKPIRGNERRTTDHFELVYRREELSAKEAMRLGATMERYYDKTARYLGRGLEPGRRLHINVAECHGSPYASAPGPHAFILVPTRSARREYGFSLVHELTHNILGQSHLMRHHTAYEELEFIRGNRLLDEGFAVVVEEKLTESPDVWPNFGTETHRAYRELRREKGAPIWPLLAAEHYRSHRTQRREFGRLAYLQQGSFCKYLVDTHGLERFLRLYGSDLAQTAEIYDKDFAALEADWRGFLEESAETP